ncbi:MAG: fused protease/ribonucleoside-triphosphate reductase [Candidatus Lokiarchaeota archaeon]|nr:fused protease/ribonucleoside-triphosphate reductase [Candidatus Lokiarchaeota archaeon]MBD3339454.1 fused protease/ribonucleoside-triphosphate reductase [Candidatus Lokiarchaeota archaeon]
MANNSFSLADLYPKYVVNSKGEKKKFDENSIAKVLNKETGLDMHIAEKVAEDVIRKIIGLGMKEISTNYIRELVCVELTQRSLNKYRNLFARAINLENISFKLDEAFLGMYKGKQPDWGPLGYVTYKRTYARIIEQEGRKEEFWETVRRVVEGCYSIQKEHCIKLSLPWSDNKAQKSAQRMFQKIWEFKMTPPGRGLWMMGTEFIARHGSMALNNCGFASTADINLKYSKAFEFVMDALMLGVGVGFDTLGAGKITIKKPKKGFFEFQIPDSREGWVEALKLVLEAYFLGKEIPKFDFSEIRPAGEPIRGFGGIASGPEPLKEMLEDVKKLLENRIGQKITSLDIVDIMNYVGRCVVAGNVRRSAEIALGDPTDLEFVLCKQDKEKLYSHRWASNNSVFARKGLDYSFIADQIKVNGEPGVFWLENARAFSRMSDNPDYKDKKAAGVNPCGEQTLESFELCCLVETFPSRHDSYEEFEETLKYAYLYAKSVTLVNTHWKETNAVMLKNRRMGISQTGIIEAFNKHGRTNMLEWSNRGYMYLRNLDEKYSDWLCIPKSIKLTTVKPSGTVSLLPGVPPGIHYPHSKHYIRRIRVSKNSDLVPIVREAGYTIEHDSYSDNSYVIEFPVHEQYFDRSKNDVSIWEQAENAAAYQKYWSDNQVSITITFRADEADQIEHVLECYEDKLKSVSFLPIKEHGYEQAPYEEITEERYDEMVSKLKPLNLNKTSDRAIGEKFCDSERCEIRL